MRRKIRLYIADQLVDLDDQSFILFNYTMDDLSNPTIVKNAYSQQITLKGTARNNRVFGGYFQTDRRNANMGGDSGVDFDASQKTHFTIYDEMDTILESGYIKLDSISRNGADIQYKVTLYGGLGSFFYALSYDDNGNKRTLADLDYMRTGTPEREFDFVIKRDAVIEAWIRLTGRSGESLAYDANYDNKVLYQDGTLHNGGDNIRVREFNVAPYNKVYVRGRSGVSPACLAVLFDRAGNVIQAYEVGMVVAYTNYEIILPSNAATLRVMGTKTSLAVYLPSPSAMWDILNFAPAYNGIPDGNFSPDKALVAPSEVGLQDSIVVGEDDPETEEDESVTYTTLGGYAMVNLAEAQEEWAVKDLRSYLQRPVLSMKAFWDAICNPSNNGGYQVDASVIDAATLGDYASLWMTLPMISSIGASQQSAGDVSLVRTTTETSSSYIGRYDIQGTIPAGAKVTANMNFKVRFNTPSEADSYSTLSVAASRTEGRTTYRKLSAIFIQAVAYTSDDIVVGGSKIKYIDGFGGRYSGEQIAQMCMYTPTFEANYERLNISNYAKVAAGKFDLNGDVSLSVEAQDAAYYKILVSVYHGESTESTGSAPTRIIFTGDGSTCTPVMYATYDTGFTATAASIVAGASADTITFASGDSLRSGAMITKAMLLSTSKTPADYMLSFCKIFGLYFTYDNATKQVTLHKRNDLYQDETIDLTRRVDLSKGISIKPLVYDSKWYDFLLQGVGGAFQKEYLNMEGIQYGIQRVNTGYDFNAASVDLMNSVVFKNACTILARSKYFNYIFTGAGQYRTFIPSPFLDKGNTYTLWNADGETLDTDISCPSIEATTIYYNTNVAYKGYDADNAGKLEFRDSGGKPIDGADVLCFFSGAKEYAYFKVTDDVPAMDYLNEGVPCWLLGPGAGVNVPIFSRYMYDTSDIIDSLDFGTPRVIDMPGITHSEGVTIYERGWKAYISDRYDVNTKVMTCRVNFAGLQVNQDLLRKFYWYDNSLWVLNAIRNYSLTTYDPVECEFIQVQDKENYLNGQSY